MHLRGHAFLPATEHGELADDTECAHCYETVGGYDPNGFCESTKDSLEQHALPSAPPR